MLVYNCVVWFHILVCTPVIWTPIQAQHYAWTTTWDHTKILGAFRIWCQWGRELYMYLPTKNSIIYIYTCGQALIETCSQHMYGQWICNLQHNTAMLNNVQSINLCIPSVMYCVVGLVTVLSLHTNWQQFVPKLIHVIVGVSAMDCTLAYSPNSFAVCHV